MLQATLAQFEGLLRVQRVGNRKCSPLLEVWQCSVKEFRGSTVDSGLRMLGFVWASKVYLAFKAHGFAFGRTLPKLTSHLQKRPIQNLITC